MKALLQDIEHVLRGGDALYRTAESNPHYATLIAFMENLKTHISIEFEQFIYKRDSRAGISLLYITYKEDPMTKRIKS